MKQRLILAFFVLLVSCNAKTNQWNLLDFDVFTLKCPDNWSKFEVKGIDSYVGGLTNGKDTLWFDYGAYSAEIDEGDDASKYLYGQDTINGLKAFIQIPRINGYGSIRLSIPHVKGSNKFSMGGYNINETDTILRMFKSIVFDVSDTTKNGKLNISDFKLPPFASGSKLFNQNCASCHTKMNYSTGPPLRDVVGQRDNDWIYKFLTNRNSVPMDSLYRLRLKQSSSVKCMEFPELTKNDVDRIIDYVK